MLRFLLVFLVFIMTIGVNVDEGFLMRLGIDPNILFVSLIAFVVTGLIVHRHLAFILLTMLMSIGANVSADTAFSMGYDPDYMLVGLVTLVLLPLVVHYLEIPLKNYY